MKVLITKSWRVIKDAIKGFIDDDAYSKASSLTFYTLLSIVPLIAILLGIAKGFGFEKAMKMDLAEKFQEHKQAMEVLLQVAYSWLANIKSGVITGLGALFLFWSVIGLFNNIEKALNAIWKTKLSRPWGRKILDYLALMIISPFLLVILSAINVYILHFTETDNGYTLSELFTPMIAFFLKVSPFILSWALFTFIYIFMPNTKVYFKTALLAGILAGTAFQIWQWIYIKFQIGAASYGAIYGSFAALPLFLIWVQVSWLILLAGAEIAYEMENTLFVPLRTHQKLSTKAAALYMVQRTIHAYAHGEPPFTDRNFAQLLGISLSDAHTILEALQDGNILSLVSYKNKMQGYQPARDYRSITMHQVASAIDKSTDLNASFPDYHEMKSIQTYLEQIDQTLSTEEFDRPIV